MALEIVGVRGAAPLFTWFPFMMGVKGADEAADSKLLLIPSSAENGHTVLRRCIGVGAPIILFHASGSEATVRRPFIGVDGADTISVIVILMSGGR